MKRQENLVIDKIIKDIDKTYNPILRLKKKKTLILVAVLVLIIGVVACGRKNDWDIEFASMTGMKNAMEVMEDGYVKIGKSDTHDGITITVVQAIGDKYYQWIQMDTNIPWTVGEGGYYLAEVMDYKRKKIIGRDKNVSDYCTSYNNNGMVSFLVRIYDEDGTINRASIEAQIGGIYVREKEKRQISDGIWTINWKNFYTVESIKVKPKTEIENFMVKEITITPITITVETETTNGRKINPPELQQIIFNDGTEIECKPQRGTGGSKSYFTSWKLEPDDKYIDLDNIKSIIINGKEISIK